VRDDRLVANSDIGTVSRPANAAMGARAATQFVRPERNREQPLVRRIEGDDAEVEASLCHLHANLARRDTPYVDQECANASRGTSR
jgi:hypothetical protein